jgi:hypothetical protein
VSRPLVDGLRLLSPTGRQGAHLILLGLVHGLLRGLHLARREVHLGPVNPEGGQAGAAGMEAIQASNQSSTQQDEPHNAEQGDGNGGPPSCNKKEN